jgi:MFS family permease
VVAIALAMVSAGAGLTLVMTSAWQLWFLWGVPVGVGTGAMALVFGAIIANRWFVRHRGLVTGLFSAASSTGQLIFLPAIAHLAHGPGWRWAAGLVSVFALLLVPVVLVVLRDRPSDVGEVPYGAPADYAEPPVDRHGPGPARLALTTLREASRRWTFWALFLTFWICGWSTNGLIGTHFIPAAHDHGMPETTSASLLALIGIFDIVGTVASGWLTDRVDSRYLLFGYYFLRGLSLLVVPTLLGPHVQPSLFLFIVFYGLDWVATVPPTVALCRIHFGLEKSGVVFGWVFASHMVGAGIAASYAGLIRQGLGDYFWAWMTAGALCLLASLLCLSIPRAGKDRGSALEQVGQESAQI